MLLATSTVLLGLVTPRPTAVVVGGGPAGLATAYSLARRSFDVTVLEQRPEPSMYEPQRAYLYLVDGRGQRFTSAAGLADELADPAVSVSSLNYTVTRCMPDGERVAVVPPILEPTSFPSYWIPRQTFLALLVGAIKRSNAEQQQRQSSNVGRVQLCFGSEVLEIERTDAGGVEVCVRASDSAPATTRLRPDLLVGADGLHSLVRGRCAEWSVADAALGATGAEFTPVTLPSPSSGLLYKMLRLPPAFRLDREDSAIVAEPRKAYSMRPSAKAPLGPTRLGLLPVADPAYPRTANVILPPEHPVWSLAHAGEVRTWLQQTFPSLPIEELISEEEAAVFATTRAGAFPEPSFTPRQHLILPSAAICLVGDAIHCFPPDIGQGVNSALCDVMHLSAALDGVLADGSPPMEGMALLRKALPAYGSSCAPEAEAVARIAQVGFPYQYPITRQAHPLQKVGWFANFFLRTFVLSKLAPKIFAPAVIVLVQRAHLSYKEAWDLAQMTTRRLCTLGIALAAGFLASALRPWTWLLALA